MTINLGSTAINKVYLGSTEIKRVYLGSTLIYDKTGGGGAWAPSDLAGLSAWYDAADASTITLSGSNVSLWEDKSVNNFDMAQPTAASQPLYDAVNDIVYSDTPDRFFEAILTATAPFNCFVVSNIPVVDGTQSYLGDTNTTFFPLGLQGNNTSGSVRIDSTTTNTSNFYKNGAAVPATTYAETFNACGFDTVGDTLVTIADVPTSMVIPKGLFRHINNSYVFKGGFKEIFFVEGTLTTDDRQKAEGYLAHKWGLAGSLPIGHPYKSAPP